MTKRLDKERQQELEPKRMDYALRELRKVGIDPIQQGNNEIVFGWNGEWVKLFPFTGWHTGKSIKDGRGINNLLKQLTTKQ